MRLWNSVLRATERIDFFNSEAVCKDFPEAIHSSISYSLPSLQSFTRTLDSSRLRISADTFSAGRSLAAEFCGSVLSVVTCDILPNVRNNNSTINGTAESAAYTYDLEGRLVTSSQTTNGVSAQRRFAYDRWGNRTGMWDATTG